MRLKQTFFWVFSVAVTVSLSAKDIPFTKCPAEVQATIRGHARDGKIDEVKLLKIEGRRMFIAEVEFPGDLELKIYVLSNGAFFKTREDIRLEDVPAKVREAARMLVPAGGKLDDVIRTTEANGAESYEVDINIPRKSRLKIVFSWDATILSRKEKLKD